MNETTGGVGFLGLLTIAFIVLKLCSVIDWAWWWVLSPLWLPFAIGAGLVLVCGLIALIVCIVLIALDD